MGAKPLNAYLDFHQTHSRRVIKNPFVFPSGGGGFDPATVLDYIFDGDTLIGLDGTPIIAWTDSVSALVASQATLGKQPVKKTGILNGHSCARFDFSDDNLQTTSINWGIDQATLFVVFSCASGSDRMIAEFGSGNVANSWAGYRTSSDVVETYSLGNGSVGSNFVSTATLTTTPKLLSATYDLTLSTNEVTNWINGVSAGSRTVNSDSNGNFGNLVINIGSRNGGASLPSGADIFWTGLKKGLLSTPDFNAVEAYLMSRFAL